MGGFRQKIEQSFFSRGLAIILLLVFVAGTSPMPALAALYQPGETSNPSCLPTDVNCGVDPTAFGSGLSIGATTPASTTNALYNSSGTLYWNGSALSGGVSISSLNGLATTTQIFATGSSGTDFGIVSSGSTHTFNLPNASGTARGLLTSGDWTTFNNKLSASLAAGNIFVGNASSTATSVTLSGDAALSNAGVLTIGNTVVTLAKLAADSVNSAKIVDGSIALADLSGDSVDSSKIVDATITNADIATAAAIAYSKLALGNSIVLSDLTSNSVNSSKIVDGSVVAADLATDAVTSAKILDGTITNADIAAGAAIALSKLASGTSGQIIVANASGVPVYVALSGDATIDNTGALTVANSAITNAKLATDAVTSVKILDGTVSLADLAANSVDSSKIVDGSVANADLSNSTVGLSLGTSGTDANISGSPASLGSTLTLNLPNASGIARGLLTSSDWTTFNNKVNASRQVTAGTGLAGGGDLSSDRTLVLDIHGLTQKTSALSADELPVYDSSSASIKKITRSDFLQGLTSALTYQGTWNASSNSPALSDGTGTAGFTYVVSAAGTQNLGSGALSFNAGDMIIYNGSAWQRAPSGSNVASVFGRTGAIGASNGDYTASQVTNVAGGNILATNVQSALNELDAKKLAAALTNGYMFIGNALDTAAAVALSGDATIDNAGTLTVTNGAITNAKLATNAVTSVKILDGTVALADLAANSVDSSKIMDGSVANTDLANSTIGLSLGTSGTDVNVSGTPASLGGTLTLNLPNASGTTRGLLTSSDWTTFNNKENAITASTTAAYYRGDKTFQMLDTSVVPENGNVYYTSARFTNDLNTKTTANLSEGSNLYYTDARARSALSVTSPLVYDSSTGALTFANSGVAAGTYGSATSIPSVTVDSKGRVTNVGTSTINLTLAGDVSGTIGANSVDKLKGTALNITSLVSNNLLQYDGTNWVNVAPSSLGGVALSAGTSGTDINVSGSPASLGGTLTLNIPDASAAARGVISTGTQTIAGSKTFSSAPTLSAISAGSVLFAGTGGLVSQDNSNLFWDNTNKNLGVGVVSPNEKITLSGALSFAEQNPSYTPALSASYGKLFLKAATGDGVDKYTKLLLHGDGTAGSQVFNDSSNAQQAITNNNSTPVSATAKLGNGSISLNGVNQYLSSPGNTDFDAPTAGNMTIDVWINPSSLTSIRPIITGGSASTQYWRLYLNAGVPTYQFVTAGTVRISLAAASAVSASTWTHVAVTRVWTGSTYTGTLYVNGVSVSSASNATAQASTGYALNIGSDVAMAGTDYFAGLIDEARLSNGVNRYAGNFTPNTAPYGSGLFFGTSGGSLFELSQNGGGGSAGTPNAWLLTGNSGLSAASNYIGTNDATDLVFKTNNSEQMRLRANGNLGLGLSSSTSKFAVGSQQTTVSTAASSAPTTDNTGWAGYTLRQRIASTAITNPTGMSAARVTFKAAGVDGATISAAYIGVAATTGNAYNFQSTPTQLTFGGNPNVTISPGGTAVSDVVNVNIPAGSSILISLFSPASPASSYSALLTLSGWSSYFILANDPATVSTTGYSTGGNNVYGVSLVESAVITTNEGFSVTSGGNVGIGATAPNTALDIASGGLALRKGADFSTVGTTNDVNLGANSLVRLTGASAQTITGIAGGTDGKLITLINAGANAATISNANTGSIAGNRVLTGTGADLTLAADASVLLTYDSGASRWRVVGGSGVSANTIQPMTATGNVSAWTSTAKVDATTASFTATLPTAAGNTGKSIEVVKTDNTTNAVLVAPFSGQTIGASSAGIYLYSQGDSIILRSDGTNVQLVADNRSSVGQGKSYLLAYDAAQGPFGSNTTPPNSSNTVNLTQQSAFGSDITLSGNTLTLAPGKIYRISTDISELSNTNGTPNAIFRWWNVNTAAAATGLQDISSCNTNAVANCQDGISGSGIFNTTGLTSSTPLKLFVPTTNASGGLSIKNASVYVEVISTAQNVINTVDYIEARKTSTQTGIVAGTDITFVNQVGNISFDGTSFTLLAGKTYELTAGLQSGSFSSGAGNSIYTWVDSTNTALANATQGNMIPDSANNGTTQSVTHAIITPSANITVKVRVTASVNNSGIGVGSFASIKQIGSTANTGIYLNSILGAINAGTLDSQNFGQTWNWSTATTTATTTGMLSLSAPALQNGNLLYLNTALASSSAMALKVLGGISFGFGTDFAPTTGTNNNVDLGSAASVRINSTQAGFTGISGITNGVDGREIRLVNASTTQSFYLYNQNSGSAAGSRIITGTGSDLQVAGDASVVLVYDGTAQRWRVVGGSGGGASQSVSSAATASSVTLTNSALNTVQPFNAASNNMVITLPTAVGNNGKTIGLLKTDNSVNSVMVQGTGGQTIANTTNLFLYSLNDSVNIISDGSNWQIISDNRSSIGQSKSYLEVKLGTAQTTNLSTGDHVKYDTTVASLGSDVTMLAGSYTSSAAVDSVGRFLLKAGKTYHLSGNIPYTSYSAASGFMGYFWYNADTGAQLGTGGGNESLTFTSNEFLQGPAEAVFTPTIDTRVEMRFTSASNVSALQSSGTYGTPSAYIEVLSTPQNIINTTDYVMVQRITTGPAVATNGTIVYDSLVRGNIPYNTATGLFTLVAGKTYRMTAVVRNGGTAQQGDVVWMDGATNTTLAGAAGGTALATFEQQISDIIYTPTTNQTVRVAVGAGSLSSYYGAAIGGTYATVQQIGSTANTGITMNSILGAIGAGTLDSANFGQTWNWSTLNTGTGMTMSANALTTGSILSLTSSNASLNSTNGLLYVANTDGSTSGAIARIQSNSTVGSGLTVLANGTVGIGKLTPGTYDAIGSVLDTYSAGDNALSIDTGNNIASVVLANAGVRKWQLISRHNAGDEFEIWSGTSKLTVLQSGSVGIGTNAPGAMLQVTGATMFGSNSFAKVAAATSNAGELSLDNGSVDTPGLHFYQAANNNFGIDVAGGTLRFLKNLDEAGGALLGSWASNGNLTVAGSATTCTIGSGTGATNCSSDSRLKTNILSLDDSLKNVLALKPVTFNWKDANKATTTHMGFIAQEVQSIFPNAVADMGTTTYVNADGSTTTVANTLGLDYASFVVPLVGAIQQQQLEIAGLTGSSSLVFASTTDSILSAPDANPVTDVIAYLQDKIIGGINIVHEFVAERIVAVVGWFNKISAKEICARDDSGAETCITKSQLDRLLIGQTAASAPTTPGSSNSSTTSGTANTSTSDISTPTSSASSSATSTESISVTSTTNEATSTSIDTSASTSTDQTTPNQVSAPPSPPSETSAPQNQSSTAVSESAPVTQPSPEATAGTAEPSATEIAPVPESAPQPSESAPVAPNETSSN